MAKIQRVIPGSIADEIGLEQGDTLLSVNGASIVDILDYRFLTTSQEFEIEVKKERGEQIIFEIENDGYEDLGLEFDPPFIDVPRRCRNKCIFCFIDQLPKGMRNTMYFKDDDYRFSAFLGNYITLTNVSDEEIRRIISLRLPRINVSVHTTDDELRCKMINNPHGKGIMERLRTFSDAGISMNLQIVLCPGWNDGDHLDKTLGDLGELYPAVKSISVVPVGITKFRQGLQKLEKFDKMSCVKVVEQIHKWQDHFLECCGTRLVYPGDEFYVDTGLSIPTGEDYEDFLQIENGVGIVRELEDGFLQALGTARPTAVSPKTVITGVLAQNIIKKMTNMIEGSIKVLPIINDFFGTDITVAGLITGGDIIKQLKGKDLGEYLLVPDCMLREDAFLDDVTVSQLEEELKVDVLVTPVEGGAFLENLLL